MGRAGKLRRIFMVLIVPSAMTRQRLHTRETARRRWRSVNREKMSARRSLWREEIVQGEAEAGGEAVVVDAFIFLREEQHPGGGRASFEDHA
jgi:hypothetical protein